MEVQSQSEQGWLMPIVHFSDPLTLIALGGWSIGRGGALGEHFFILLGGWSIRPRSSSIFFHFFLTLHTLPTSPSPPLLPSPYLPLTPSPSLPPLSFFSHSLEGWSFGKGGALGEHFFLEGWSIRRAFFFWEGGALGEHLFLGDVEH